MPRQQAQNDVEVQSDGVSLDGLLVLPTDATALVIFAHGSGSSRLSPRNQRVADYLNDRGFATLLFDLLTSDEESVDQYSRAWRFDIHLLSRRLEGSIDWVGHQPALATLPIGLFGASTGAAAALIAAANRPGSIGAVVSRGGRPDLADAVLDQVRAPTLLIVGGYDPEVIELNEKAAGQLVCEHAVSIVPGATHLFEEPGKLRDVCRLATYWFKRHLVTG